MGTRVITSYNAGRAGLRAGNGHDVAIVAQVWRGPVPRCWLVTRAGPREHPLSMDDVLIGRVIASKFAIEALIGSGAMGAVYRARHLALDKPVAVKVLHQSMAHDATFAARLRREAMAASRLDHPNSVRIVDFGEEPDGLLYIAMELLDGLDLLQVIERDWPFSDGRIIDLLSQTLNALARAHELGIVHRDLKPENIMVVSLVDDEGRPRDRVKVCDFGIAKIADANEDAQRRPDSRAITMQNAIIGTPEYMSPEQCRGEPIDARSDLYSVGVVLYQLLAGRVPFQATNLMDVLFMHISEEPAPPSKFRAGVPRGLEDVCLRALRKRPAERYASAREMRVELRAAVDHLETGAGASPPAPSRSRDSAGAETLPSLGVTRRPIESATPTAHDATAGTPPKGTIPATNARTRLRRSVLVAAALVLLGAAAFVRPWKPAADVPLPPVPSAIVTVATVESKPTPDPQPSVESPAPSTLPSPTPKANVASTSVAHRPRNPTSIPAALGVQSAAPAVETRPQPPAGTAGLPPAFPLAATSIEVATPLAASTPIDAPAPFEIARTAAVPSAPSRAVVRRGHLAWNVTAAGGGATTGTVARALARLGAAWQRCYDTGLTTSSATAEGSATMRLTCDDQGRVVGATVSGFDLGDVASCIRASTAGLRIPNADTGEAWASVALTFTVVE
jgi:YD repeat-containing protein